MNSRTGAGSLALVLLLSACASTGGEVSEAGATTAVQFSDIPIPDGMQLRDGASYSHSVEVGEFRFGDFHYVGSGTTAEVASYMRQRMGLHGWVVVDPNPVSSEPQRVELRFERRPHSTTCEIWQEAAATHMKIAVRTEVPK